MIKKVFCLFFILIVFLLPVKVESGERLSISIPNLKLEKNERIMGFSITVYQGHIVSLPDIPYGWSIHIENSGNPTITAGAIHGANALFEPKFIDNLIVIEKDDQPVDPFNIKLEIYLTKDFENFKSKVFKMKDLKLRKVKK